jgi:hypothetical protein
MKTYIQLKDGIGFATVVTPGDVDYSSVAHDGVEVATDNAEQFINKKYNSDGSWSDADLIYFAEVDANGFIVEIKRTYFSSLVDGPILPNDFDGKSKWVDGAWTPIDVFIEAEVIVPEISAPVEEVPE